MRPSLGISRPKLLSLVLACSLAFAGGVRAADEVVAAGDPLQLQPTPDHAARVAGILESREADALKETSAGAPVGARHPEIRVRTWVVPGSAEEVQKFYRGRWPKHAFFPLLKDKKLELVEARLFGQHLRWKPQGLEPTGNRELLARHEDGLGIFLLEMAKLPYDVQEILPAARAIGKPSGGRLCILSVVTFRPVL